ncbi:hypothetical protein V9K67_09480 [Paraflavisolibacter sp. H34]|uniref:M949_RS01915 family surface polysaccharide biosynthesis protein n=1 Tax=Huijunlia imazamoxiresistens TaxID=3127457 RepID=UPI00301969F6
MRQIFTLFTALFCSTTVIAQKVSVTSELLTLKQVAELFPDSVRKRLDIPFPVLRVYKYADKTGQYYCLLTESRNETTANKDAQGHKIRAVNVTTDKKGSFIKVWEINDHIVKNDNGENSIWFWTKYIDFKDYDEDGLADPIIVYGTSGINNYDDGRIKLIIYYKRQKTAIRHQNGVLDYDRETQVDKAFYDLPQSLQAGIHQKMELMMKNNQAIFPSGWQTAMKNKKAVFNERRQ